MTPMPLSAPFAGDGPAVLRLRMIEMDQRIRRPGLDARARRDAEAALALIRRAILASPHTSFADLTAKLRTALEISRPSSPGR